MSRYDEAVVRYHAALEMVDNVDAFVLRLREKLCFCYAKVSTIKSVRGGRGGGRGIDL